MNRILALVPAEDTAGRALHLASALAERTGARLSLLRVLEEGAGAPSSGMGSRDAEQLRDFLVEAERRELERLAAPLRFVCEEVDVCVCWGVPWEVVVERAREEKLDLVVKPARGLGQSGGVFFGSTALNLFRKCPCPVWVVGDDGRLPERLLAAIDPSGDPSRRSVAQRLLEWSARIADWTDATPHVATAWQAPAADLLTGRVPQPEVDAYVQDAFGRARASLAEILDDAPCSLSGERVHLIEGSARDVLPRFAEDQGFDLVLLGSLGRSRLAGELLGETAETIIRSMHGSVLVLTPPDGGRSAEG